MKSTPVIILTRPLAASNRLAMSLAQIGCPVMVCPTLSTETVPVTSLDLACLEDIDLIFFVSGAAVRAFGEQLQARGLHLKSNVQMAAVGLTTATEIGRVFGRMDVLLPAQGASEDSESLWKVMQARGNLPRHVLIVRGQSGREWFAEQLRQHGIQVSIHAAYCRTQATWGDDLVTRLHGFVASDHLPVIVSTSQQGILAFVRLVKQHGLYSWCRNGRFVITHSRHQQVLVEQFQFIDVKQSRQIFLSGIQDDVVLNTLRSVCKTVSCN